MLYKTNQYLKLQLIYMKFFTSSQPSDDRQMPKSFYVDKCNFFQDIFKWPNTPRLPLDPRDEQESHSSEQHKQSYSPSQASQPIQKDSEAQGAQLSLTSEQEMNEDQNESTMVAQVSSQLYPYSPMTQPKSNLEDQDQDDSEPQEVPNGVAAKNKKKAAKRKNDNNNAHKPYITVLNDCLKNVQKLKEIKKDLKISKVRFMKGSRYSFVTRLIDIKQLLGQRTLHKILDNYCQVIKLRFDLPSDPNPAQSLLFSLIVPYQECCQLFYQGKEIEAVSRIYDIKRSKERQYKLEGIEKVMNYRSERFPKIFKVAKQAELLDFTISTD